MKRGEYYSCNEIANDLNVKVDVMKGVIRHLMITPKFTTPRMNVRTQCYTLNDVERIKRFVRSNINFIYIRDVTTHISYEVDLEKNCTIVIESKLNYLKTKEL